VIFQDFPGPGIFKKKIQDFPGGVGTLQKTVQISNEVSCIMCAKRFSDESQSPKNAQRATTSWTLSKRHVLTQNDSVHMHMH